MAPFYYGFYGNAEALYFSTGWSWVFRILSGMLILLLSYVAGSAVIAFACYWKKEWCSLSLRIAYCTLILLTGTPLSKVSPFNLVLMFFIIQLLGLWIIQASDVMLRMAGTGANGSIPRLCNMRIICFSQGFDHLEP